MKYQNGKIYKITSPSTDMVYVGSTCMPRLCQRLAKHKQDAKKYYENGDTVYSSGKIIQFGDAIITLIENFPCTNKDELRAREQYWIDNTPNTINKNKAFLAVTGVIGIPSGLNTKEYMKQYNVQYRQLKLRGAKLSRCSCGGCYNTSYKDRHLKSATHKQLMQKQYEQWNIKFHQRIIEGLEQIHQLEAK